MKFTKMHGCGNDCICINNFIEQWQAEPELVQRWCNRHYGIGADNVITLNPSDIADFQMRVYNLDGYEAEMCGNGIRCATKMAYDLGIIHKSKDIRVETLAGIKIIDLVMEGNTVVGATVDMGKACFFPNPLKDYNLQCVDVGNPHAVMLVEGGLELLPVRKLGADIEHHPAFPDCINVEFVQILNRSTIKLRVWERGCGETLGCGTGSSAAASALVHMGLLDSKVNVKLPGGELIIEVKPDYDILMTGNAIMVYHGTV